MKRNCLNCPGQGPASRARTPKGALTCMVLQKEATPRQGTGHQLAVTRASACLILKHGKEKGTFQEQDPSGADRTCARSAGCPPNALGSWGVPFSQPLHQRREGWSPTAWASASIAASLQLGSSRAASPVAYSTYGGRKKAQANGMQQRV